MNKKILLPPVPKNNLHNNSFCFITSSVKYSKYLISIGCFYIFTNKLRYFYDNYNKNANKNIIVTLDRYISKNISQIFAIRPILPITIVLDGFHQTSDILNIYCIKL